MLSRRKNPRLVRTFYELAGTSVARCFGRIIGQGRTYNHVIVTGIRNDLSLVGGNISRGEVELLRVYVYMYHFVLKSLKSFLTMSKNYDRNRFCGYMYVTLRIEYGAHFYF